VEVGGNEARADTLNGVRPRLTSRDHRRQRRFDCKDPQMRPSRFENLRASGDVATGTHARYQCVNGCIGEVAEDLGRSSADMDFDIGRVLELLRHPCAGCRIYEFDGAFNGTFHPFFTRGQVE